MNFQGQRLEEAYFVTCVDAASRYALCIPIVDRTNVVLFIEESITQFMSVLNRPLGSLYPIMLRSTSPMT